jgi:hypothetical protein
MYSMTRYAILFWTEVVVNLWNAWCPHVTVCKFGDVLLCLVFGVQRSMVAIFDKILLENYAASSPRVDLLCN